MASMSIEKASSLSLFSSSIPRWKYDVFLSFRGEDTRNSFTDHLYAALKQKGIVTFRDEENLERGKSISPELLKAIEESRFAIVILSRNYASSIWCLDELVNIIRCMKETGMIVMPAFYNVHPSDVRKQTGTFIEAFNEHEEKLKENIEKVQTWRAALREVANLSGWHVQDRSESNIVQNIVGQLWHKLSYSISKDTKDVVGIESRVKKLESCLAIGLNDVRIIGVWGMGGIGKTTLVRVVFRMISSKFEGCCFLANVREISKKNGIIPLQQQLILQILNESMCIKDVDDGVFVIKNRLRHKKILLILDDVSQLDQLNKLAGKHIWFGSGSRVIITTRDKHLLQTLRVDGIYEANGLNDEESLQLFSLKAFKKDHPPKDYLKLSKDFVYYAKGLPLAIEISGSFLFGRSIEQCKSILNRLKEFPATDILQVLRISFDELHETEKEIFLHIACFFNHKKKIDVVEILDNLGLYPDVGLEILIDKSLVKFVGGSVWMHDLLQELGKNIVYEECPKVLGKRSRLWLFEDINDVLTENTGTEAIQGIVMKLHEPKVAYWNPESFSKINHLKMLIIDNIQLQHDLKGLPNALRLLDWSGYPSKSFPSSFQQKSLERLKFIRLKKSLKLNETPDFNKIPNLEKLDLQGCINLPGVHPSIGVHKKLTLVNLKGCKNLKTLLGKFEMESLEILILSGCSKIKRIPEFGKSMKHLLKLYLDGTAITKLPTSIEHLAGLASLNLRNCENLMWLPNTLFNLKLLRNVDLSGCSKLEKLPENLGNARNIEELDVSGTAIRQVPSSIGLLKNIKVLYFRGCKRLSSSYKSWYEHLLFYSMPRSPNPLDLLLYYLSGSCSMTKLDLSNCNLKEISNDIGCLFSLEKINLSGNNFFSLPSSIVRLSNLTQMRLYNCMSLQSFPKLPLNIRSIGARGCISLEMLPDLLQLNDSIKPSLFLENCLKLTDNQGFIDMFIAVIKKILQGLPLQYRNYRRYGIVVPGSHIPEWFSYQSMGAKVNIKEPSHLCNDWMGIAVCAIFFSPHQIDDHCDFIFYLIANGKNLSLRPCMNYMPKVLSDHLWLFYFSPQYYDKDDIKLLWECDTHGFSQIGIRIETEALGLEVKKCGFRMVYKKDIEDLNQTMTQCSNNCITAFKGLDVFHHNFNKVKRNRDDYDGTGPSGEGRSNDVPHPKRIERLRKFMALDNSDCKELSEYEECGGELSEYEECGGELSDWEKSSESNLEG